MPNAFPATHRFGETTRRDTWWIQPLLVLVGLGSFVVYATWAAFQGEHYTSGPYLSPFYSPELWGDSPHAWFGPKPGWWPGWAPFSPALLILWAPGGFRLTCYYYRGAYYKGFWADPPACAVGEPRKTYRGEARMPLILQNVHRYFLYLVLPFLLILWHDAWKGLWFTGADGVERFGLGVGSVVLLANCVGLSLYALGCHSLRHRWGGFMDQISRAPVRRHIYPCVSCLNTQHMRWAWCSLISVMFADLYVRLCSMGIWTDVRIF